MSNTEIVSSRFVSFQGSVCVHNVISTIPCIVGKMIVTLKTWEWPGDEANIIFTFLHNMHVFFLDICLTKISLRRIVSFDRIPRRETFISSTPCWLESVRQHSETSWSWRTQTPSTTSTRVAVSVTPPSMMSRTLTGYIIVCCSEA